MRDTPAPATAAAVRATLADAAGYGKLGAEVAELQRRAAEPNAFAEPAVAAAAADGGQEVAVALAWNGDRLVGALPVAVERGPMPRLTARLHPYAVLSTPLLDAACAEPASAALLRAFAAGSGLPKRLDLPFAGGAAEAALFGGARAAGMPVHVFDRYERARLDRTPGGGESWAARRYAGHKRKKWRQEQRRLAAEGVLAFAVQDGAAASAALEVFLRLEEAGWKGRRGTAVLCDAADAAFLRRAVAGLAARNQAAVHALTLDGRPIAMGLVLAAAGARWFHKLAYDEAFARFSPGEHLAHALTMHLLDEPGFRFADSCALRGGGMLAGAWSDAQPILDVSIGLGGNGPAFALTMAAERLRRSARAAAKAAWLRLRRRP